MSMPSKQKPTVGLLLPSDSPHHAEWDYVWSQIFPMLGVFYVRVRHADMPDVVIQYGQTEFSIPKDRFVIRIPETLGREALFATVPESPIRVFRKDGPDPIPDWCFSLFQEPVSPLEQIWMQNSEDGRISVSVNESGGICGLDIPATVFYFLSLANEKRTEKRDEHGRFRKVFSPLGTEVYDVPVVDRLVRLLRELIYYGFEQQGFFIRSARWPDGRSFAVGLSHDVDKFQNWTLSKIRRAYKSSQSIWPVAQLGTAMFQSRNKSGNFEYIKQLESSFGASSTAFILSKRRSSQDPDYTIGDGRIQTCVESLGTPGLHGSYSGGTTSGWTSEERTMLESVTGKRVTGVRSHYLMFDHQLSFRNFVEAGLRYDSTLGFAEAAGWRCGTGFPFQPWDEKEKKAFDIVELPLVLMDTSFFLYEGLDSKSAWEAIQGFLNETKQNGSSLVVNWHNNNVHAGDLTEYTQVYQWILEWTSDNGGERTDLENLIDSWEM